MKKKILIILLVIILFILVKIQVMNKYTISNIKDLEKIKDGLILSDLLVINTEEVDDYIEYKNIKIKNIFNDYDCIDDNDSYTCIKDDNTSFSMKIGKSYLDKFKNNKNSNKIIKDMKIKDDLSLFGVIKETKESNIMRTISSIKRNYILNKYAIDNIPKVHSIDLIEGDYSGLLFHTSSTSRELYLYVDDKTYIFIFNNLDEFNDIIIHDLMNSIIIK